MINIFIPKGKYLYLLLFFVLFPFRKKCIFTLVKTFDSQISIVDIFNRVKIMQIFLMTHES